MNDVIYRRAAAVTPHDTNASVTGTATGLYVGGAGAVVVTMDGGGDATFSAVPAGTFLRIAVTAVKATGTTATLILALYS